MGYIKDIKDIEKIVKCHIEITDEELDDIDSRTSYFGHLVKQKPSKYEWGEDHPSMGGYNIIYNLNEYGYRSDNFNDGGDGIVFLGCSLTQGYGLDEHEIWPRMVGKHFDVKVWNLGYGGRGGDVCFMNVKRWIPKLKPKVVCILIPSPGRFQFFDYNRKINKEFFTWKLPKKPKFPWLFNPKHLYLSTLKNVMGIKLICDEYNIPFIAESAIEMLYPPWPDEARDGNHPGPKWQKRVSELFIEEIEKCI